MVGEKLIALEKDSEESKDGASQKSSEKVLEAEELYDFLEQYEPVKRKEGVFYQRGYGGEAKKNEKVNSSKSL